jgi:hypothetical protein
MVRMRGDVSKTESDRPASRGRWRNKAGPPGWAGGNQQMGRKLGKEVYCVGLLPAAELSVDVLDLGELEEESEETLSESLFEELDSAPDLRA